MTSAERRQTRALDYGLAALVGIVFLILGLGAPGFWEPWESSIVQVAQHLQAERFSAQAWWVPQNEHHLVHKPLGMLWSLAVMVKLGWVSELGLRLPSALLGMGVLTLMFHFTRRFFTRQAAFASILVLVSLPMFAFSARLLLEDIWITAGVTAPVLLLPLARYADSKRREHFYGGLWGLSLVFSLITGGFFALGCAALINATFFISQLRRRSFVLLTNVAALVGLLVSVGVGAGVFMAYRSNVPYILDEPAGIIPSALVRSLTPKTPKDTQSIEIESVGLSNGRIMGEYKEAFVEQKGARFFVVDLDGGLRGTPAWELWLREPKGMPKLFEQLEVAGFLDDNGQLAEFSATPDKTGATKATLEFFSYNLFDPSLLVDHRQARVRSLITVDPSLGVLQNPKDQKPPAALPSFLEKLGEPVLDPKALKKKTPSAPPKRKTGAVESLDEPVTLLASADGAPSEGKRGEGAAPPEARIPTPIKVETEPKDPKATTLKPGGEAPENKSGIPLKNQAPAKGVLTPSGRKTGTTPRKGAPKTETPKGGTAPKPNPRRGAGKKPTTPKKPTAKKPTRSAPIMLKPDQLVTILEPADASGWVEVEVAGNRTGFVREEVLEIERVLPQQSFHTFTRQLAYGLFPWILLLPFILGMMLHRRLTPSSEDEETREEIGSTLLVWIGVAIAAMVLGANFFNQRVFSAVPPVAIATGVWIGNPELWKRLDHEPFLRKFIGFAAVGLLVLLLHDFYKNPWIFINDYLQQPEMKWDEKLKVMERPYRVYRAVFAVALVGYFFGAVGFGNRILARIGVFLRWRFETASAEEQREDSWVLKAWTRAVGPIFFLFWRMGQVLKRPRLMLMLLASAFAVMNIFMYLPQMTHHLTQKGLLDRYTELAQSGEPLYNMTAKQSRSCKRTSACSDGQVCVAGQCRTEGNSFYLAGVEEIRENSLINLLTGKGNATTKTPTPPKARFFSIIPLDALARINSRFRASQPMATRRSLVVLDDRSSRFVLVSGMQRDGEEDVNPLNPILSSRPFPIEHPANPPILFENGITYLGYDLDPEVARSGTELTVTYHFCVDRAYKDIEKESKAGKKPYYICQPNKNAPGATYKQPNPARVLTSKDWQIFLHIDEGSNRINGDHHPGEGKLHTNTWVEGDYIRDVQKIEVDRGSAAGEYTLWFGFFVGSGRLKAKEGQTPTDNRLRMGKMQITGGL